MARKKKKAEQEGISAGWINTFADLMAMLISIIFLFFRPFVFNVDCRC